MINDASVDALLEQALESTGPRRIPRATYRLQFNQSFPFAAARDLVPYLRDLGISDCYASPILRARAGSAHGYDISHHGEINPDLGTLDDYRHFSDTLRAHDLGMLVDIVPNHMGIGEITNVWWIDVLENGPSSRYAKFFDIDWEPLKPELKNKVLLPILGDQYGIVLENGDLRISYEDNTFWLNYYEHKFPIAPRSYLLLLQPALEEIQPQLGETHECVLELMSIMTSLENLPLQSERRRSRIAVRQREKEVARRRIATLRETCPEFERALDHAIATLNGQPGDPNSFNELDRLLEQQAYRLAYWRVAAEEINYRRFFDINDLVALRMEDPEVFAETHRLIFDFIAEGRITGLRIDHPDGMWNPGEYLHRLQEHSFLARVNPLIQAAAARDGVPPDEVREAVAQRLSDRRADPSSPFWRTLYIVVEKILGKDEPLPAWWPVDGTTGYEFANAVNGVFVDTASRRLFDTIYADFIDQRINPRTLVNATKKMIMLVSLASEINLLSYQLNRLSEANRRSRDFTLNSITFALREVIAALPVYRTYTVASRETVDARDEQYIRGAVAEAKRRNPRTAAAIFDFIQDILLLKRPAGVADQDWEDLQYFVMKFQQTTGPVMAKGLEDTAFYIYNRLVSLNEVGGEPDQFGISLDEFHAQNLERAAHWPHSMLTTSTHDTKRSEDVRARMNVLSELPVEWRESLNRWAEQNRRFKRVVDGQAAPDRNEEYLLYQTLLGAWPSESLNEPVFATFRTRVQNYLQKAIKEAKVNTSWVNPNDEWDQAVGAFVAAILDPKENAAFLEDFAALQEKVAYYGRFNALAQVLIKLTAPGMPDIYQGTELWDLSLVDPDNRRPVDYALRQRLLAEIRGQINDGHGMVGDYARGLIDTAPDGRIKLFVTHRTLDFRRQHPDLFANGSYQPLSTGGSRADHLCAYARAHAGRSALVIAPRLCVGLTRGKLVPPIGGDIWLDTWVAVPEDAAGAYRNVMTGETVAPEVVDGVRVVPVAAALANFPVALLTQSGAKM